MLRNIHAVAGGGRVFWEYLCLAVAAASLQAVAVLVLFPLLGELFSDHPVTAGTWVLVFLGIIALAWGADILTARRGLRLGIGIMRVIGQHAPEAVLAWPASKLTPARTAALRSLMANGAVEATSAVILMVTPIITATVFTFALGLGLLTISVPVALVTVLGGVLMLLALWASTQVASRAQRQYSLATEELDNRLFEFAWAQPSLRTARSTSAGQRLVDDAITTTRGRVLRLLLWQIPGEFLFSLVLQLVLIGFGVTAWLAFSGNAITAAAAATLVIVLLRVVEQVTVVSRSVSGVLAINQTLTEVREIIETTPVTPAAPATHAPHLVADGLHVTYPDGSAGLQDVSLDLPPGTVTVVVGRSGSGKTTLLRTLAGLTPATAGTISLDGHAATEADLLGNATVVFQQTALSDGTIRENLLAVNPALGQAGLERIADTAQLPPVLQHVSNGWDTPVGELGAQLSGGERQRVGIARALAKPAHLLLVDEATSALDAHNEQAIVESISRIRHDYTTVLVSHRPAVLRIADAVIVMADGRIAEQGSPSQLEASGGQYARLLSEWQAASAWHV